MNAVAPPAPANLLLVDDVPDNLVALKAILEPLGQVLVCVPSGEAALKELLLRDFACILLDVQMPVLDGFETATLIKQRARTRTIPIIFLTAISKEQKNVFRGYETGAVDYLFKPFDPDVLRSKVSVFIDLYQKNQQLHRQAEQLREQELASLRRESEERYRQLADAMPQIVWTTGREGGANYFNRRWFEYTGMSEQEAGRDAWTRVVHPDDLPTAIARREETLRTGDIFEIEYRFRGADGTYRWHLGRAVPMGAETGAIDFWVGTATDIHDRKRIEEQRAFLMEAGDILSSSLDYRATLVAVAGIAVPKIADWCSIDMLEDGAIRQLAISHADPAKVTFARELQERYPTDPDAPQGAARVIRTGEPELVSEIDEEMTVASAKDELHLDLIRQLGLRSYMCVPLTVRGRVLGAITFVSAESDRYFGDEDVQLAMELARRAATAVENAELYREAEQRAQAARVLAAIGDGVVLLDSEGIVRLWNKAAEAITGIPAEELLGRAATEALPGFQASAPRVPVAPMGAAAIAFSLPVDIGERELWLSISGVGFEDGTVYAFRDLTHERALEEMRQDLVATVSHELRTPLAAIYGASMTLRRGDIDLDGELKDKLLEVIEQESSRLAEIVNDLLTASQLDAGKFEVRIEQCDAAALATEVVDAARTHLPEAIELVLDAPPDLPLVAADPGQLRQVLANLVDNAIKYSPDGGLVRIALETQEPYVRFAVSDSGLGIPPPEQRRIFEKFYRLDPDMTRGIGGTGLGLYISRELVRRVNGRIWVESGGGAGSTFFVEVPLAPTGKRRLPRRKERAAA